MLKQHLLGSLDVCKHRSIAALGRTRLGGKSHLRIHRQVAKQSPSPYAMSSSAPSTVDGLLQPADLELSDAQLDELASDAMVWASQHGLVVGSPTDPTGVTLVHAPIAALPVAFPRKQFLHAKSVQPLFNVMVDAVAKDEQYLEDTLQAAARQDTFTQRLLDILRSSRARRASLATAGRPEVCLGIHRTDYMLDTPSEGFLQVELNTIASSFGCLSSQVTRMHHYILSRLPPGMLVSKA
ncbi:eukaryotic glutathione synthase, partial [Dunaliella salina]